MDPLEALARATISFAEALGAVPTDSWDKPSVCDGWTVRDLADHVLGGNRFAVGLLAGQDSSTALETALGAGFEGDPADLYGPSAAAQLEAFRAPGALERIVRHPAGDISGVLFLWFRVGDLALHGWDLARSTGGDSQLDEVLLPDVWAAYQPTLAVANEHGAFGAGPSGNVAKDAPLALRLLDLTGRRP